MLQKYFQYLIQVIELLIFIDSFTDPDAVQF